MGIEQPDRVYISCCWFFLSSFSNNTEKKKKNYNVRRRKNERHNNRNKWWKFLMQVSLNCWNKKKKHEKKHFCYSKIIQWPFLNIYFCAFCIIVIRWILIEIEIRSIFDCIHLLYVFVCLEHNHFVRFCISMNITFQFHKHHFGWSFFFVCLFVVLIVYFWYGMLFLLLLVFFLQNSLSIHTIRCEWSEKWFNTNKKL